MDWRETVTTADYVLTVTTGLDGLQPDRNYDFHLRLCDGQEYMGTFFTVESVQERFSHYRKSGECATGAYFYAQHMIFLPKMNLEAMQAAVEGMIRENDLWGLAHA